MRVADFEEGLYNIRVVPWRSGDATVCKTVYTGSIPVGTSRELRIKHCHKKMPRRSRGEVRIKADISHSG